MHGGTIQCLALSPQSHPSSFRCVYAWDSFFSRALPENVSLATWHDVVVVEPYAIKYHGMGLLTFIYYPINTALLSHLKHHSSGNLHFIPFILLYLSSEPHHFPISNLKSRSFSLLFTKTKYISI